MPSLMFKETVQHVTKYRLIYNSRQTKLKRTSIWYCNPMHIDNANVNNGDFFYYCVMHTNMPSLYRIPQVNINHIQNTVPILKCSHEYLHDLQNQTFRPLRLQRYSLLISKKKKHNCYHQEKLK